MAKEVKKVVFENVQKMVKKQLKDDLKQYGFKTRQFNFYRQINGVVQGFKIYANGHYTIRYNMYPLVGGLDYDNYCFESQGISDLTVPPREPFLTVIPHGPNITEADQIAAWENRYNIYIDFANQLVNEVYEYLLPLFFKYDTPEKHIENNEWNIFGKWHKNYYSVIWSLQARNYDLAFSYFDRAIEESAEYANPYFLQTILHYKTYFDDNRMDDLEKHLTEKEELTLKSFGLKR